MRIVQERPKRHFHRLPISFPVFIRSVDQFGKPFRELATVLNVSAGGLMLAMSPRRIPDTNVILDMPVGEVLPRTAKASTREIPARIVWSVSHTRCRLLGLKFPDLLQ